MAYQPLAVVKELHIFERSECTMNTNPPSPPEQFQQLKKNRFELATNNLQVVKKFVDDLERFRHLISPISSAISCCELFHRGQFRAKVSYENLTIKNMAY